ncbi:hypothetical protein ACIO3O_17530 [Streptomyces sp. NPDC087440]|uniref:DUF7927 domain-containing protein n=1 Tax=Streptomyces sp. NPDC087440 TaxID=3365790 RepID=UPI003827D27E
MGLVGLTPLPAYAADYPLQSDAAASIDCDHLYYSNYLSGSQFDNDASGEPEITNRVVSRRPAGSSLPAYWSTNSAIGRDPDTGKPTLFYSHYTTANRTLYKHVQGTDRATDVISGTEGRQLPPGYNWGGLGADPTRDMLFGAQNLSSAKQFFSMNLKTGATKVFQPKAADPGDRIWPGYTSVPDIFVDTAGFPYMGAYSGSNTYIYRIDVEKETATRVVQITGPGAQGGSLYGLAWHKNSIYLGHYNGTLYKADPATGVSTTVPGGQVEPNRTGDPRSENGGSWPITDLASCALAPPLVPTLKVSKSASVNGAPAGRAKPGDKVTYTVKLENTSTVDYTGATATDDLTRVLANATYNGDATALDSKGTAIGRFTATPPPSLKWEGTVPAGETATLTYSVTVKDDVPDGAELRNTVVANDDTNCASGSTDPDCGSVVPLDDKPRVVVVKTSAPASVKPGEKLTYTITLTNPSRADYPDAKVEDDLTGVLGGAVYGNDAAAKDGSGAALTAPTYTAPKLSWTGPVKAGGKVVITYTVTVRKPLPAGQHTLRNAVTTDIPGQCPPGSTDPECGTVTPVAELKIKKSGSPRNPKAGDKVTYTVTLKNDSEADWTGATTSDDLSDVVDDATFNDDAKATSGGANTATQPVYDAAAKKLTWTGTVAKGATVTITYTVTVNNPPGGNKKLANAVVGPDGSSCEAGSTDPDCNDDNPVSGLKVKKTASTKDAKPGDTITYTVTAENTGGAVAKDVTLADDLTGVVDDATYNNDAKTTTGGANTTTQPAYDTATKKLTWTGDIAAGATVTMTYTVTVGKPPAGDKKLTNAVVGGDNCPPGSTDPECSNVVPVGAVEVRKVADRTDAKPGEKITYTVTVRNTGEADYKGATFADDLSGVLDDASWDDNVTAGSGTAAFDAGTKKLTWTGDVTKGATVTVTYSVTVGKPPAGDKKLTNAVVGGENCPPGSTDPECGSVTPIGTVEIRKVADRKDAKPGEKITYTVTVTNRGEADYKGASFTDDLSGVLDDASWDDNVTAGSGTAAFDAGTKKLTWTGDVTKGATVTVTYSVTVGKPPAGDKVLKNAVTGGDNCPPGSTDPECGSVTPVGTVEIRKVADRSDAKPGERITYTVTVRNTGQADVKGASFADDLSGVLDDASWDDNVTAGSGTAAFDAATKKLTWTGDVAKGATVTVTYSVTVGKPPAGDKVLKNAVTGGDNCPPGSTDPECGSVTPVGTVEIRKVADRSDAKPGERITYTVTVRNTGQADVKGASFADDLSGVLDDASWDDNVTAGSGTAAFDAATKKLTWTGDVAKGATVTVTYSVTVGKPPAGDKVLKNAVTGGDNCPPGSTDPECGSVTPVGTIEIRKVADRKDAKPGDKITYTVTVRNTGEADYKGASFADDLSGVLDDASWDDNVSAGSGTAAFDAATKKLTWTGDVAKGATVTVTYSVTVGKPPAGDKKLTNGVVGGDNCPPGSTDPECSNVVPVSAIEVRKAADVKDAKPGDKITYTVTVRNTGEADYKGARFSDDLSGVLDDAVWDDNVTASSGTAAFDAGAKRLTWTGDVAKGATVTVTYSVTVGKPPAGDKVLKNAVTGGDNCPPGSTDPECGSVTPVGTVEVRKVADRSDAKPGERITYTVTVRNTGQADVKGASFADDLSGVLDDASWDDNVTAGSGTAAFDAGTRKLTWSGDVAKGATVTVTYSVTVGKPPAGDKVLKNAVTGGENCPPGSTDPECGSVTPVKSLTVKKSGGPENPKVGDTVTYTVTVRNTGGAAYEGASFTDDLRDVLDDSTWSGTTSQTVGAVEFDAAGQRLTWKGDLAVGQEAVITYQVVVTNAGNKYLRNVVSSGDSNCEAGSDDPDCREILPKPGLEIRKQAAPASAGAGDTVTYTVTVRNTSADADYSGASFTDDLSGVLDDAEWADQVTKTSGTTAYDAGAKSFRWNGDVARGTTVTVTYKVVVGKPPKGDKKLSNTVVGPEDSSCPPGSTDPACGTVTPVGTIEVKKTSAPKDVKAGQKVTYTVTVTNTGEAEVKGATFSDDVTGVLDDASWDDNVTATGGAARFDAAAKKLNWTGDVAKGATVTVTYSVTVGKPPAGDKVLKNAVTGGENCPPGATDPECSTTDDIALLDLKKTASPKSAKPGETVTYTVVARNAGTATYRGAAFEDDLSAVLDDARYNGDAKAEGGGTVVYTAPVLRWTHDLPAGATVTITYSVTVDKPGTGDKELKNAVAGPDDSSCPPGSTDPDCGEVVPVASLEIRKTSAPAKPKPGQKVTYTVTVTNTGGADYPGASFRDDLSGVLDDAVYEEDAKADAGAVVYARPHLTWTGDVAKGATVTVTYSVTVGKPPAGDKVLKNGVVGPDDSTCPPGSTDPECSNVTPVPVLVVKKSSEQAQASVGQPVRYTVTIENTGEADATGATLTDDLTDVLDDADWNDDATADSGTVSFERPLLTWTGDVAKGAKVTVTYSVTFTRAGDGTLRNTAVVPDSNCEPGSTDPDCGEIVPPEPDDERDPELEVVKTATPSPATAGGKVTYTLLIRNVGAVRYDSALVADDLTGVLDDASYNQDATATAGRVDFRSPRLIWTGDLAVGASVTVRYSVTVGSPPKGDKTLRNVVDGGDKSNCPDGSTDPSCGTVTPVTPPVATERKMEIRKTATPHKVKPGGTVTFTITARNTGKVPYRATSFSDDLRRVLDDAAYNGDARASSGTVRRVGDRLVWNGPLAVGQTVTVTFSVTVRTPLTGDGRLKNVVTGADSNCLTGQEPGCTTTPEVIPPKPKKVKPKAVEAHGGPGSLPHTGSDGAWGLGGGAAALLVTGGGLMLVARRRG